MTELPPFRLAPQTYDPAIPVEGIREHPGNPNKGATGVIDESLAEHGFYGAILVQRSTGLILVGNHRYREALAVGAETLPGFWLDVDDAQAAKILAVDNQGTRLGTYDEATLLALLQPMADLRGTGFTPVDLDDLVRLLTPPDLNELARGAPEEEDMWPLLRFRVSPADRERFYVLTDPAEDKSDAGRFAFLLNEAG